MAHRGEVFKTICSRLREYRINIDDHIADESLEGELDAGPGFEKRRIPVGIKKAGTVIEGTTTLVGITFRPKNFQNLMTAFKDATRNGSNAFHYHPLTGRGMVEQVFKDLVHFDPLQISYAATKAGMPGKKEQRAWGFREIRELTPTLDDRKLSMSDVRPDRKFGARFSPPAIRKVDITSLHAAVTPEACNIHIDDVGFVIRGPNGMVIMSPDFLQHIINELVFKTNLRGVLGEWVTDHFSIIVPSSDNYYSPTLGIGFNPTKNLSITASFTFGCKCLPSSRLTLEERIVPIPDGWSVGVGLELKHDFLGRK